MAQIEERDDNVFRIKIFLGRDENGKRQFWSETFHGGKRAAEKRARKLETLRDNGGLPTSDLTLNEYIKQWIEGLKGKVSEQTRTHYSEYLRRYVLPKLGFVAIRDLNALHIQDLHYLHSRMTDAGLSPRTIRHAHSSLYSFEPGSCLQADSGECCQARLAS
jgi:hypothetical protein